MSPPSPSNCLISLSVCLFVCMFYYFLRMMQYFFWNFPWTFNSLLWQLQAQSILGYFGSFMFFFLLLYFLRTVQHFLMKSDGLYTRNIFSQYIYFCSGQFGYIWAHFGIYVPLFLENHSALSLKVL